MSTPIPGPSFSGFWIGAYSCILQGDFIWLSYDLCCKANADKPSTSIMMPERCLSTLLAWELPPSTHKLPVRSSCSFSVFLDPSPTPPAPSGTWVMRVALSRCFIYVVNQASFLKPLLNLCRSSPRSDPLVVYLCLPNQPPVVFSLAHHTCWFPEVPVRNGDASCSVSLHCHLSCLLGPRVCLCAVMWPGVGAVDMCLAFINSLLRRLRHSGVKTVWFLTVVRCKSYCLLNRAAHCGHLRDLETHSCLGAHPGFWVHWSGVWPGGRTWKMLRWCCVRTTAIYKPLCPGVSESFLSSAACQFHVPDTVFFWSPGV